MDNMFTIPLKYFLLKFIDMPSLKSAIQRLTRSFRSGIIKSCECDQNLKTEL